MATKLSEEEKHMIIKEIEETRKSVWEIAKICKVDPEAVYEFLQEYHDKEDSAKTNKQEIGSIRLQEIYEWCKTNNRKPRTGEGIKGYIASKERIEFLNGKALVNFAKRYEERETAELSESERENIKILEKINEYPTLIQYKAINKLNEILEYCNEKKRKPRTSIEGVRPSKEREIPTPEQEEINLAKSFTYLKNKYMKEKFENSEDNSDREIREMINKIDKYPSFSRLDRLTKLKQAFVWTAIHNVQPRMCVDDKDGNPKSEEDLLEEEYGKVLYNCKNEYSDMKPEDYKTNIDQYFILLLEKINIFPSGNQKRALSKVEKTEIWCKVNNRMPRTRIGRLNIGKLDKDSEEAIEMRRRRQFEEIKKVYNSKYGGIRPSDINNRFDRLIFEKVNNISDEYSSKKSHGDSNIQDTKKTLALQLINLIKTRNATLEQLQIMANYYDVDLEDVLESLNNREDISDDTIR